MCRDVYFREVTCPKCGKKFVPASLNLYKDREKAYCSYTCFSHRNEKVEKENLKRYFVYLRVHTKADAKRKFYTIIDQLKENGVTIVSTSLKETQIDTNNVSIIVISWSTNLDELECDEAFGFTDSEVSYLRRKKVSSPYQGRLIDYILEKEC